MRFQRISNFTQQYRTDATWMNLSSSVSVSNMNAVKLQTSNQPFYFNYRTRNRGKGWLGYILSKSTAEFAGWKGYPVTGLEIQMYNNSGTRIFEDYIVMFRSKVAGEWLSWISNASLDIMEEIQNEQGLGGTLDGDSTFSGWESKGDIQAIDIRVYKDNGTNTGEILPPNVDFSQQYRTNTAWMNLNSAVNVTSMNAIRLLTRNKPYFLKYRTRNRGKGWLGYILSTNNTDFAGWKGYPVTGFEIQLFANNGTRLFDTHAVMYRSKVAGEWLSWISNVSLDIMERLQTKHNLGGTLDASSTFSGWESRGDVQAIDIRVYENVGTSSSGGETPPPVIADFAQQYRTDSTWLNLTPSVTVTSMNAIRLQTKNKPFYLNYRTRNRGKGWLGYILSTNSVEFAGWRGFPVSGMEIQLFANNGARLFDTHAVMYRSKVAGEWLSWISNVDEEIMTRLQLENNLGGTLDPSSDFSGWESRGDIQAIEIRLFENVGASTGELPPAPPDSDFDIPNAPNNPNGYRIYIDAGHGGSDPGACNGSCYEKNYTLELSLLQKQYFEQAGYKVTLSREDDRFVDNAFKANQANQLNADLYIANHINSFGTSSPNGVEVYNQVNPYLTARSKSVAQKIVANLSTMFNSRGVKTRTQDDGRDWYCVLRETRMAAVLVEHCFISNSADLAKLNDPSHIDMMAKAVVKAVCDTILNPPIVAPPVVDPPVDPPVVDPPVVDEFELAKLDEAILKGHYNYFTKYNNERLDLGDVPMDLAVDDYNVLKGLEEIYLLYLTECDGEKMDQIYEEIKSIRQLPQYKNKYINNMDSNGVYADDYIRHNNKKTTKIFFKASNCFTSDEIIKMHQKDTVLTSLAALIPGVGIWLSMLMGMMQEIEQNGTIDMFGYEISKSVDELTEYVNKACIKPAIKACLSTLLFTLPTIFDVVSEDRESYVKNGVRVFEGDTHLHIRLVYDLGVEAREFEIYLQQQNPITLKDHEAHRRDVPSDGHPPHSVTGLEAEWRKAGYELSEISDRSQIN